MVPAIGGSQLALAATGWQQQPSGTTNTLNGVSAVDADTAWVVGSGGTILRTTDGGASWETRPTGGNNWYSDVGAVSKDTAWITGTNSIYRTIDGGATFQAVLNQPAYFSFSGVVAFDSNTAWAVGNQWVYYGYDPLYSYSVILKTTDGGVTWATQYIELGIGLSGISAADKNTAWVLGHQRIMKTTDGGSTWSQQQVAPPDLNGLSVSVVDSDTVWISDVSSQGTHVQKTRDGGTGWTPVLNMDPGPQLSRVAACDANTAFAIRNDLSLGDIYRTADGGSTWTQQVGGETQDLFDICTVDANTAWAVGLQGLILHTTDGGGQGQPVSVPGSLSPGKGPVGTEVTIKGSNFGALQGSSYVTFGQAKATDVTFWSDNEIRCLVPSIDPGTARVRVSNGYGTAANAAVGSLGFVVIPVGLPAPTVTAINPAFGANYRTLPVSITGTGFVKDASVKLVRGSTVINGKSVNVNSDTYIYCTFDLNGQPLGKYDVMVKNIDDQEGTLAGGFSITDICGQGGGASITLFVGLLGLLSVAGLGWRLRRRRG